MPFASLKKPFLVCLSSLLISMAYGQESYHYAVDLNQAQDDQLSVSLECPTVTQQQVLFYLPKIVPGTYMNSNYGKYVHNLKAFDKAGKELPVSQSGDNSWQIKNAKSLYRITYKVEDTWDSDIKNKVYPMCGTNFEAGKNFVVNTCGLFGYLEGKRSIPFELSFTRPANFYAATGLKPVSSAGNKDVFRCSNADELYDSPLMFSAPDTTTIKVGGADVLIAVYSPHHKATSRYIADHLDKFLAGAKNYLGGKLPVDKYAFIFYFNGEQKKFVDGGAWEHSYSSFYSLEEEPQEEAIDGWVDVSAHEFFHIVTPLTICSREVREFNFNETVLSKHLWLYEGSTEYYAHHMQVWAGLKTPDEFLATLANQIRYSRTYFNDSLSFTEMSKESAGKWKDQYNNVYLKGSLISACIDLYLLKLSGGYYGLRDLKHDLGVKYGKDNYFKDDELFDVIGNLSYPQIKDFLLTYVQGSKPIPYEQFFGLAGVDYIPKETNQVFTLGGIGMTPDSTGQLILSTAELNDFGKKMGYQEGDQLVSLNGTTINAGNLGALLNKFNTTTKDGDVIEVVVNRKGAPVKLSAPAMKVAKVSTHLLRMNPNPTEEQLKIRKAWLGGH